jgi:phosphoglycolate phosphatase-like HAD superfamily hydrolase
LRYSFETLAAGLYQRIGLPAQLPEELLLADAIAGPRYRSWLFDGVAEALDALSAAGVRMGIIADTVWTSRMLRRALAGVGLAGRFGLVTLPTSSSCRSCKTASRWSTSPGR